ISYTFKLTNTGNVPLLNVSLTDPMVTVSALLGLTDADQDGAQDDLLPGAMATATGSYQLAAADVAARMKTNTASADATAPNGVPVHGQDTAVVLLPLIEIIKTNVSPGGWNDANGNGLPDVGEAIDYAFKITNDGKLPLFNVTVADPAVTVSAMSGLTDVDLDGRQDDLAPNGMATATGRYVIQQADINAGQKINKATAGATDPDGNSISDDDTVSTPLPTPAPAAQLVQFITPMSVFRPDGPFQAEPLDPNAEVAISGHKWHDLNQDGIWNANEPGRAGWTIYLDVTPDNVLDPVTEPFAITDADGRYVFTADALAGLPAGFYAIREDRLGLSDGTFEVQKFPAPDPGVRDPDEHLVEWSPGTVIQGRFGAAETPNFGTFDYSPFIRPADEQLSHLQLLSATDKARYLTTLMPWQSIVVTNTTSSSFNVIGFDTSMIAAPGNQLVTVVDANGFPIGPGNPIPVAPGASVTLFAFYDPAIRSGDTVIDQFPDWLGDKSNTNPAHTFTRDDQLTILTDSAVFFPVNLFGGSTYDSDIFYDAAVDRRDFGRLNDDLLTQNQNQPIVEGSSPLFDPTSDINARCPNGAEGIIETCSWALAGTPLREIALGDYGTLNVEFGRARAPFLDLDADNSSESAGVNYSTEFSGSAVPIVDSDGRFANFAERVLSGLSVAVTNPELGDQLHVDKTLLPAGIEIDDSNPARLEFTTTNVTTGGTVFDYNTVLSLIRFSSSNSSPAGGRFIEFTALGSANAGNGRSFTTGQLLSNLAVTRVLVVRE
ncbi:MAG: hypothetical protein ABI614_10260, partial [Planctomycetota bacterium]